ncbi:Group XV phospholipase A2 [Hypsibius exemplaris]|uniref:Group XV phospholipase A2 n=1 Tax=Hypsibius exemplaris TaxID=2072580 RepID=A0A1W0WAB7_HYPEX|nr:Group XV phospholipase A2 [Hypsibius exemplaris]
MFYLGAVFVLLVLNGVPSGEAGILDRLKDAVRGRNNQQGKVDTGVRTGNLSPVIILPGDGGSALEAMLDRPSVLHRVCPSKTNGWNHIWADFDMLIPALVECWVDNLKLIYNKLTRKTTNQVGVQIRVPGFGDTNTIEYLTKTKLPSSKYFAPIVEMLVGAGYQRGISVRGAPYDFRKSMNEQDDYFSALKTLIEETYEMNTQSKVTFLCHSLGNLYFLYFLNRQSQEWKDKYVNAFVGMGGPWGGAVKALKVIATGDDLDIPIVSGSKMRDVLRTNPSVVTLLPTDKFWAKNETLISTPDKLYNLGNIKEFFEDLNYEDGWEFYQDTKNLVYDLTPPRVKVFCLSGTGVSTPAVYYYRNGGFPSAVPAVLTDDGDGTVTRRSLDGCGRWEGKQPEGVISQTFQGAGHRQMTRNPAVLQYIMAILFPNT